MKYQREVRLGLVLYGGVSLAVYENGIAQELHRAIRGDGVYGLLCALIDSDIVVDIISGTSAGGVNGVMLAYALANKCAFAQSAELWRNDGDIQRLLRTESDPDALSVLNSAYYQQRLENCFQNTLLPDKTAPEPGELDLFVTSTDAKGAISTVYDDLGHAIDIKNHRALFKLSYRGERKNDLNAPSGDLAKLCRMTSCFPVAFEPVLVGTEEENFIRWGKLRNPAVYLDGGILNNKPFTSTIDAIATRTANREVERFLIYVEPNPEQFVISPEAPLPPPMAQAAVGALVSIPGYQSIAGDLAAIEAHNQRAGQIAEIVKGLDEAPDANVDTMKNAGVLAGAETACNVKAYYASRLIQIRDAAVEAILNDEHGRAYFPARQVASRGQSPDSAAAVAQAIDLRRSGRILVQSFDQWRGESNQTLQQYDVFYRLRRTGHLSKSLMRRVKDNNIGVPSSLWDTVNHFFKLYEIAQWAMIRWLTKESFGWQHLSEDHPDLDTQNKQKQKQILGEISKRIWGEVQKHLDVLMRSPIEVPTDPTPEAREMFYIALEKFQGRSPSDEQRNLLDAIDDALKSAIGRLAASGDQATAAHARLLCNEFCRFFEIDRQLFPIQFGSDFMSTDLIRVVRFSPLDAQRGLSRGSVENKVRGIALHAFGGFFKKGWRANDIMVGRLDAACLLVECLLTKERLAAVVENGRARTPAPDDIQRAFPSLTPDKVNALIAQIGAYLATAGSPPAGAWDSLVDAIVEAAQKEIYCEEYLRVVACSIEQEHEWGQYRVMTPATRPYDSDKLAWFRAKKKPDEVIVQLAAQAIANVPCSPVPPGARPFGAFVDEIPEPVLQELGALATIRLGKGLLTSISNQEKSQKLAGRWFYKVPFRLLAPIVYRFARMRRLQPTLSIVLNTAIVVFCLTLMAAVILLPVIGWPINALHLWLVGIAALAVLLVWAVWFRK
ncbi:MAG: patatin-like protein [Acidobacteriota bacterium]